MPRWVVESGLIREGGRDWHGGYKGGSQDGVEGRMERGRQGGRARERSGGSEICKGVSEIGMVEGIEGARLK